MLSKEYPRKMWSLIPWIIGINVALSIGSAVSMLLFQVDILHYYGALRIDSIAKKEWWRFFTYMWLHANPLGWGALHVIFNMMMLWMFGRPVERALGKLSFLGLYLAGALVAASFFFLEFWIRCDFKTWIMVLLPHAVIGASGAIAAIFTFFAGLYPDVRVYIMFIPYPIKIKYAVIGFVIISFALLFYPPMAFIGHSAHIGGVLLGFIWWLVWKSRQPTFTYSPSRQNFSNEENQ